MGTTGLEQFYDSLLRGEKGYNFQVVDVKNTYKGKYKDGKDDGYRRDFSVCEQSGVRS